MFAWMGFWNYIRHPGVPVATYLRVVTGNNSLNNHISELPEDNMLFDEPDATHPLQQSLAHWRTQRHEVMTDLARTYNTVLTGPEELHMQRLVWRWGRLEDEWQTYGLTKMRNGDGAKLCSLQIVRDPDAELERPELFPDEGVEVSELIPEMRMKET